MQVSHSSALSITSAKLPRLSTSSQILLWFGASISIAEIFTGTFLAPLGISQGLLAIGLGHLIGAGILYLVGVIGADSGYTAAQSSRLSFGKVGSYGFSSLNILQLIGWTAVMVRSGAEAFDGLTSKLWGVSHIGLWCVLIAGMTAVWIALNVKGLIRVNRIVVSLLLVASVVLAWKTLMNLGQTVSTTGAAGAMTATGEESAISFAGAVELNVAMCLSWLPLIADYTRQLANKKTGTLASVIAYVLGSSVMFAIGLSAAIATGQADIAEILLKAGLGLTGLLIVVFSTATTAYLDVHSAALSTQNLFTKLSAKPLGLAYIGLGLILALLIPMSDYEEFLYLIGSVFAPLFAILLVDYYIFNRRDIKQAGIFDGVGIGLWVLGVILYRYLLQPDSPMQQSWLGITLPVMLMMGVVTVIVRKIFNK